MIKIMNTTANDYIATAESLEQPQPPTEITTTAERIWMNAEKEKLEEVIEVATADDEYPVIDYAVEEKTITVRAAKQKLDWEGMPAYKQTLLRLAQEVANRQEAQPRLTITKFKKKKAKNKQAKAARKRNHR